MPVVLKFATNSGPVECRRAWKRVSMSMQTNFLVQAFTAKGTNLKAGVPIACRSEQGALRTAQRLALVSAGVVAFSTTSDAETGDYDEEPKIFFREGLVPDEFSLMP